MYFFGVWGIHCKYLQFFYLINGYDIKNVWYFVKPSIDRFLTGICFWTPCIWGKYQLQDKGGLRRKEEELRIWMDVLHPLIQWCCQHFLQDTAGNNALLTAKVGMPRSLYPSLSSVSPWEVRTGVLVLCSHNCNNSTNSHEYLHLLETSVWRQYFFIIWTWF